MTLTMKSSRYYLTVLLFVLIGSSMVQTKKNLFTSTEDCVDFNDKKLMYNLPDDILPWNKLNKLEPCCVAEKDISGCVTCNDSVAWKFTIKDHDSAICAVIPKNYFRNLFADDMESLFNTRKRMDAESVSKSKTPSIDNTDSVDVHNRDIEVKEKVAENTLDEYSERNKNEETGSDLSKILLAGSNIENKQALTLELTPHYNVREFPPVYNSKPIHSQSRVLPSEQRTDDNELKVPAVDNRVNCQIPLWENYGENSDWYPARDAADEMFQMNDPPRGEDAYGVWNNDQFGYPSIHLPRIEIQNRGVNEAEDQRQNDDVNQNTNIISNAEYPEIIEAKNYYNRKFFSTN